MKPSFLVTTIIAGLATASASAAQSVPPAVERQLLATRDSIWQAWYAHDTTVLSHMLPKASVAGGASKNGPRWDDRATIDNGSRQFAASGARLAHIEFADTKITLDGNIAFITSNYMTVIRSGTRADTSRGHAAELFVRDGDHWVNPFWHLGPKN